MNEATIRAQVELQYALDRMSTPLHASRLSAATAAEDARCMAIICAEIDRLTRERDEHARWRAELADKLHATESLVSELRAELERERMRLVACGVVAMSNTSESAERNREMHADYRSASCDDVARAVDREMALRAERDALAKALDTIHSWLVCAAIASAEDMAQSFAEMEQIAAAALAQIEQERSEQAKEG